MIGEAVLTFYVLVVVAIFSMILESWCSLSALKSTMH